MTNLEKVEKIREKTNITYEEAKAALESCDWDILDAILKLEAEGKIKDAPSGADSSANQTAASEETDIPQKIVESYQSHQNEQQKEQGSWEKIRGWIKKIFRKSCDNKFVVRKHGEQMMEIPVLLLVILLLFSVWTILIVLAIGLFFGFSYSFAGPDLGKQEINDAMAKANDVADDIKSEFQKDSE